MSRLYQNDSPCKGVHNVSIIVYKMKLNRDVRQKRIKLFEVTKGNPFKVPSFYSKEKKGRSCLSQYNCTPEILHIPNAENFKVKNLDALTSCSHKPKYMVNLISEHRVSKHTNPFNNSRRPVKWRVYRCQLNTKEETCCCSCNSDAMFEVMKSLYDCYKKKNCDHCNCILCGHLPREERKLGELRKSGVAIGLEDKALKKIKSAGIITPLEGQTAAQKEKILQKHVGKGMTLPEEKKKSEKLLLQKVKTQSLKKASLARVSSEIMAQAKEEGLLEPLEGKPAKEKERVFKALAMKGLPLPEGQTASEKNIIEKVRRDVRLPPAPKTASQKSKYQKAQAAGLIVPLEGKSKADKENTLIRLAELGIPLPEGKTASEKSLIAKIKVKTISTVSVPLDNLKRAKAAGYLTPLDGKTTEEKEKILKGLAMEGIPLPELKTASDKLLSEKVRQDIGLPPVPKTSAQKKKYEKAQAAGLIVPLEGKTTAEKEMIQKKLADFGIPLPEARTASEKALVSKIKSAAPTPQKTASEKLLVVKETGLLTSLEKKPQEEKEKILRGQAMAGIPLAEAKTTADKKIVDKVRRDLGLPPVPRSAADKEKHQKAQAAGLIVPLEGKTRAEKDTILRKQQELGIPLPTGRTPSEKALVAKVIESAKLDKKSAKVMKEGKGPSDECICALLTPESEKGKPVAEVYAEKLRKATAAGILPPLEGKTSEQKEKILKAHAEAGYPLPEGKTASEKQLIGKIKATERTTISVAKVASEKLRKAKAAGLITPLEGKTAEQKEAILKGLAKSGVPLPVAKTESEKKLMAKVRTEIGLPPEPKTVASKRTFAKLQAAGVITPLEGKAQAEKEKAIKAQAGAGLTLPEDRTVSDKALISKLKSVAPPPPLKTASEKLRAATEAGLLTPLEKKPTEEKEKILRGQAMAGIPLAEAKTTADKKLVEKVRQDLGLPPAPKSAADKEKHQKAQAAGLVVPLEGKTRAEKDAILRKQQEFGIPLPTGRTPSEKALVAKVIESAKLDKKSAKVMKEGKGPSDECICALLTPESEKGKPVAEVSAEKLRKATAAGILPPLEGKTPEQKEKILKAHAEAGHPLPEGKTASEKQLIGKIKATERTPVSIAKVASEKLRKAKAAGLITPLEGKTPEQKEAILKGLAKSGVPLPVAKTESEKKLMAKVRTEIGLPPEPKTVTSKRTLAKLQATGVITPLEGKAQAEKEKAIKAQAGAGLTLPEDRTVSDKALISKIKSVAPPPPLKTASEKLRAATEAGLLTPLEKKPTEEKEKILRGQAMAGIPLAEAKTTADKKLVEKVRQDLGLPPAPKSAADKEKHQKAQAAGLIVPLEGKTRAEKDAILRKQQEFGIPLPTGRTPSEKALVAKVIESTKLDKKSAKEMKEGKGPSDECICALLTPESEKGKPPQISVIKAPSAAAVKQISSEKLRKAKAAGLITSLTGKSIAEKEKIVKSLAGAGLPLPEAKTASEKSLVKKVKTEFGIPSETKPISEKSKVKTKSKKIGIRTLSKKLAAKGVSVKGIAATGVEEDYEDIMKTTTCDRGCGCDKKKIRFKHSYVKIRVTSPDISSLCPCPNECLPGVKGGVFMDNEGIKVTVGSALGVSTFCSKKEDKQETIYNETPNISLSGASLISTYLKNENTVFKFKPETIQIFCRKSSWYSNSEQSLATSESFDRCNEVNLPVTIPNKSSEISVESKGSRYLIACCESYDAPIFRKRSLDERDYSSLSYISLISRMRSLLFLTSEDSLSIKPPRSDMSLNDSSVRTTGHYLYCEQCKRSYPNVEETDYFSYDTTGTTSGRDNSDHSILSYRTETSRNSLKGNFYNHDITIFRMSRDTVNKKGDHKTKKTGRWTDKSYTRIAMDEYHSKDMLKVIDRIIATKMFNDSNSSILVIVPTSDECDSSSSESGNSTVCLRLSENLFKNDEFKDTCKSVLTWTWRSNGLKLTAKGKNSSSNSGTAQNKQPKQDLETKLRKNKRFKDYHESAHKIRNQKAQKVYLHGHLKTAVAKCSLTEKVSDEFTVSKNKDWPCFCPPLDPNNTDYSCNCGLKVDDNVASEIMTPMLFRQSTILGLGNEACLDMTNLNRHSRVFLSSNLLPSVNDYQPQTQAIRLDNKNTQCRVQQESVMAGIPSPRSKLKSHESGHPRSPSACSCDPQPPSAPPSSGPPPQVPPHSGPHKALPPLNSVMPQNCCFDVPPNVDCGSPCNQGDKYTKKRFHDQQEQKMNNAQLKSAGETPNLSSKPIPIIIRGNLDCSSCKKAVPEENGKMNKTLCESKLHGEQKAKCSSKCLKKSIKWNDSNDCSCQAVKRHTPDNSGHATTSKSPPISDRAPGPENLHRTGPEYSRAPGYMRAPEYVRAHEYINATEHPRALDYTQTSEYPQSLGYAPASEYPYSPEYALPSDGPPIWLHSHFPAESFGQQYDNYEQIEAEKRSVLQRKKLLSGVLTQEETIEDISDIDKKGARQMLSDLTQTTSGFNFKVKKKPPPPPSLDEEWSFQEAINYYASLAELANKETCTCTGKCKNKKVKCECPLPVEEPPPPTPPTPPEDLKGFKISIGGKGSASKGLNGVCCFNVEKEDNALKHEREVKSFTYEVSDSETFS